MIKIVVLAGAGRLFFFLVIIWFWTVAQAHAAGTWTYGITAADTPGIIDTSNTGAQVDKTMHEIHLPPKPLPGLAAFSPDGSYSYAVLTTTGVRVLEYDGMQMTENLIAAVTVTNPLALALPVPTPDVLVATANGIQYYGFTGSGMTANPALSVAGLTGVLAVGSLQAGTWRLWRVTRLGASSRMELQ